MLPATPQRTADSRRVAPTPMIDAVVTCVVETGTANTVAVAIMHAGGDRLGGEPAGRRQLDDPPAQRADDPEAAGVGAGADRQRRGEDDPQRDVEGADLARRSPAPG